jgi:hypothetical protein
LGPAKNVGNFLSKHLLAAFQYSYSFVLFFVIFFYFLCFLPLSLFSLSPSTAFNFATLNTIKATPLKRNGSHCFPTPLPKTGKSSMSFPFTQHCRILQPNYTFLHPHRNKNRNRKSQQTCVVWLLVLLFFCTFSLPLATEWGRKTCKACVYCCVLRCCKVLLVQMYLRATLLRGPLHKLGKLDVA